MRLVEYEDEIRALVEKDINDPKLYKLLQQMIEMFLRRKKVCDSYKDYSDMSYTMASDILMSLLNGEEIHYFLGYLEKYYRKYAHQYYANNRESEAIISFEELEGREHPYKNSASWSYEFFNNECKEYLRDINRVIDEVMHDSCKYDPLSTAYTNLKLSLILSLLRDQEVSFHLTKDQEFYLKIILINFKNKVKADGLSTESVTEVIRF